MAKKTGTRKAGTRRPATGRQFTAADLSFNFGLNVRPKGKGGKRKPAGGGSV